MSDIIPATRYMQKFERYIYPLTSFMYKKLGLTPNRITLIGLIFGLLSAYYLTQFEMTLSCILFLLAYPADALDGIVARQFNLKSAAGCAVDDCADHLAVVAFGVAAYYASLISAGLAILVILIITLNTIIKNYGKFDLGWRRSVVFGFFLGFPFVFIVVLLLNTISIIINVYKLAIDKRR